MKICRNKVIKTIEFNTIINTKCFDINVLPNIKITLLWLSYKTNLISIKYDLKIRKFINK